ncbi:hypothetical protein nbrc107696_14230 [Gordonia spumicola]|uniref:Uncharacterized protein n=1 Tax=Gordonia spumicola TaxID=589161 RepID=A0A7I9V6R1_9ACTN|nr:hypothetical protein [Gordonia spumicola]GEE00977.1 hypothetical protein nbrc107696_14230 [Gordonia spumicola]
MALHDAQLVEVLDRTVATIDQVLDVLSTADVFDVKRRSCLLSAIDWPGTPGWDRLSMNERADWWVSRVGAITTTAVAFPSMFGVWTKWLPVGAYLGVAGQALVVRAVAREYGATSRESGVVMLGEVLFGRDVSPVVAGLDDGGEHVIPADADSVLAAVAGVGRTLYDLTSSLGSRPGPPRFARWAGMVPLVGGPFMYLGERIALRHAVDAGRRWIVDHPTTVAGPEGGAS